MPADSTAPSDPIDLIAQVNRGRVPGLLQRKFEAMAADPFVFLRATAALGHRSVDLAALPAAPVGWICGDLHLQNYGSFRGANRLVYFDLNDFDEAARLPLCLDPLRLLGSLFTAAPGIGLNQEAALTLARQALHAYARALAHGKAFWLERDSATGPINALLRQTQGRKRRDLLATRTRMDAEQRVMNIEGLRYLAVAPRAAVRQQIESVLEQLGEHFGNGPFFELRDIAFRVAGMGSLGLKRYVALVRGKGDPDRNALIDFKHAAPSAAAAAFPQFAQPAWDSEAARVVGVQDLCQAAAPAYLCAAALGPLPVIVRELQPVEDKVALAPLAHRLHRFDSTLESMAQLSAYAQLRSAGRRGAAGVEELIAYGQELLARPQPWIAAARAVAAANQRAFDRFREAWADGDPRLHTLARTALQRTVPRNTPHKSTSQKNAPGSIPKSTLRKGAPRKSTSGASTADKTNTVAGRGAPRAVRSRARKTPVRR